MNYYFIQHVKIYYILQRKRRRTNAIMKIFDINVILENQLSEYIINCES